MSRTEYASRLPSPRQGEAMSAYIAGPMRGYTLYNFPTFFKAALSLRSAGWKVYNPAEYDIAAGVDPAAPPTDWPITVEQMLKTDFLLILQKVDSIIMLPGWQESSGASTEMLIAFSIGLPIYELTTDPDLDIVLDQIKFVDLVRIYPKSHSTRFEFEGPGDL